MKTETSPAPTEPSDPPTHVEETLGRYRIERELGAGGMGVVYQAFDPELERRVALKVLTRSHTSPEAHERLLREARAMARLNHPNVVTVYEAGSAAGRDYVAMELVEGTTLIDWLRDAKRSTAEILAAFIAAGRGLAAAHEAGVIHRDFKPHNVMRDVHGNIAVTDFGLAADIGAAVDPEAPAPRNTPSPLGGLTPTGSILGTPAYMAPEQWQGRAVGPNADQFAFCVALWEALAGERPYRGTEAELRAAIERGPSQLDASPIPRRLREVVMRGLEPDPERRWPSMMDVLAKLERARRRNKIAFAIAGAIVIAAIAVPISRRGSTAPTCAPPVLDPATVWPAGELVRLIGKDQAIAGRMMSRDMGVWLDMHATACHGDPAKRAPILTCLDGMLAKLDVVQWAVEASHTARVDPGAFLLDPKLCTAQTPPRFAPLSKAARTLIASWLENYRVRGHQFSLQTEFSAIFGDPCVRALSLGISASNLDPFAARQDLDEGFDEAEACGDDQLLFELALADVDTELSEPLSDKMDSKLERLRARLGRVGQPDTEAEVTRLEGLVAYDQGRYDRSLVLLDAATEQFIERGRPSRALAARMNFAWVTEHLRNPEALAALPAMLERWHAAAITELDPDDMSLVTLEASRVDWRARLGDLAGSHALLARMWRSYPNSHTRDVVTGHVVDTNHHPVAGATVGVFAYLDGDSLVASLPRTTGYRAATTGALGEFKVTDASYTGLAIAQLGDRRSRPVVVSDGDVELVLEQTHRIEGRVALDGPAATLQLAANPLPVTFDAMLTTTPHADGTFELDGVLGGKNLIAVTSQGKHQTNYDARIIDISEPVVRGLVFDRMSSPRVVHVILRSASLPSAGVEIVMLKGRRRSTTLDEVTSHLELVLVRQWVHPESVVNAPEKIKEQARLGDLVASFEHVPATVTSVCVVPTPKAAAHDTVQARAQKVEVPCLAIAPTDEVVIMDVPAIPRFE